MSGIFLCEIEGQVLNGSRSSFFQLYPKMWMDKREYFFHLVGFEVRMNLFELLVKFLQRRYFILETNDYFWEPREIRVISPVILGQLSDVFGESASEIPKWLYSIGYLHENNVASNLF